MWELYQQSKLWHKLPSEIVRITDDYIGYCFDEAVALFGTMVTQELEKIKGKDEKSVEKRRNSKLNQLLGVSDRKRFRQVGPASKK